MVEEDLWGKVICRVRNQKLIRQTSRQQKKQAILHSGHSRFKRERDKKEKKERKKDRSVFSAEGSSLIFCVRRAHVSSTNGILITMDSQRPESLSLEQYVCLWNY